MIEKESFDAIVMDFMMPEMDGLEALKAIKEKKPELQIILLTGHATVTQPPHSNTNTVSSGK